MGDTGTDGTEGPVGAPDTTGMDAADMDRAGLDAAVAPLVPGDLIDARWSDGRAVFGATVQREDAGSLSVRPSDGDRPHLMPVRTPDLAAAQSLVHVAPALAPNPGPADVVARWHRAWADAGCGDPGGAGTGCPLPGCTHGNGVPEWPPAPVRGTSLPVDPAGRVGDLVRRGVEDRFGRNGPVVVDATDPTVVRATADDGGTVTVRWEHAPPPHPDLPSGP